MAWFELDHPATQSDKRGRLERLGLDSGHIVFVPADFTSDDVTEALAGAGLSPGRPSLVTCEGVAVYLEAPVLERLLAQLRAAVGPGSRLAISLSADGGGPERAARRAQFQAAVAALGEPARNQLTAAQADSLLGRTGWSIQAGGGSERARGAGLVVAVAG